MGESWLIPDDGIIDEVAIETAVRGRRRVRLTTLERSLAAALILALGGSTWDLTERLHVSFRVACQLARQARRLQEIAADEPAAFPPPVVAAAS